MVSEVVRRIITPCWLAIDPADDFALLHNGLGERDEAIAWLQRAYEERDALMVFLKIEPKWNNIRSEPHFQHLLRRLGFSSEFGDMKIADESLDTVRGA